MGWFFQFLSMIKDWCSLRSPFKIVFLSWVWAFVFPYIKLFMALVQLCQVTLTSNEKPKKMWVIQTGIQMWLVHSRLKATPSRPANTETKQDNLSRDICEQNYFFRWCLMVIQQNAAVRRTGCPGLLIWFAKRNFCVLIEASLEFWACANSLNHLDCSLFVLVWIV